MCKSAVYLFFFGLNLYPTLDPTACTSTEAIMYIVVCWGMYVMVEEELAGDGQR
jgi:hypothetical protein